MRLRVPLMLLISLALLALLPSPAGAQRRRHPIQLLSVAHTFGERVSFEVRVDPFDTLDRVLLFYQAEGQSKATEYEMTVDKDGQATLTLDLSQNTLPVFSPVPFWIHAEWDDGRSAFREFSDDFIYADNRFDWQTVRSNLLAVHFYEGDIGFARQVHDTGIFGMEKLMPILGLDEQAVTGGSKPIDIYVYPRAADLQSALLLGAPDWVAGHANPGLEVVLVSINPQDPEYPLEIERQIPHELAHILLHKTTGPGYSSLPTWLNEGIASVSELYPNPDYPLLLQSAYQQQDGLIPIEALCHSFPSDASQVLLAYAQASSFTRFVIEQHGNSGLQSLLREYSDGKSCQAGAQAALGRSLGQLEIEWRQAVFEEQVLLVALEKMLPWLVLLAVLVAPLLLIAATRRPEPAETSQAAPPAG